ASETSPTSATSTGETRHAPGRSPTRSHASAEASTLVTIGAQVRSSGTGPRARGIVEGGRHARGDRVPRSELAREPVPTSPDPPETDRSIQRGRAFGRGDATDDGGADGEGGPRG